jgi:hypothetical protein
VAAENRLTIEQLAALNPGDTVTIESGQDFSRPRYAAGTVIRVGAAHVDVCCDGAKGAKYVERYHLRDGLREGRGRAELVRSDAVQAVDGAGRRRVKDIDTLYRRWHRRPGDLEALRQLRDVISEHLDEALVS